MADGVQVRYEFPMIFVLNPRRCRGLVNDLYLTRSRRSCFVTAAASQTY